MEKQEFPKMVYYQNRRDVYEIAQDETELELLKKKGFGDLGKKKEPVTDELHKLYDLPIKDRYKNILQGLGYSHDTLKELSLEQLIEIKGIGKAVAEDIAKHYGNG